MKTKKIKAHIKRGQSYARDRSGTHKNFINPQGAGIMISAAGKETMF